MVYIVDKEKKNIKSFYTKKNINEDKTLKEKIKLDNNEYIIEDNKEKKPNKKLDILKEKNIIRDFSFHYKKFINLTIGSYYGLIHGLIVFLGGFTVVFSNNLLYLCIILFIVSLDSLAIVALHDCPLTQLEEKYLGLSGKRNTKEFLHKLGIVHKCDHMYESQLEFVINMWMVVVMKILIIIVYGISKKNYL